MFLVCVRLQWHVLVLLRGGSRSNQACWMLNTVDCHARPMGSLAMTQWVRLKSHLQNIFLSLRAKRSNQQARNPLTKNPQKKRAQSYGEATAQRRFEDCNFWFSIAHDSILPATAHSGNVRAVGITLTHALWTIDICKCNAQLKSVRGFGGLLRGIRGALRK